MSQPPEKFIHELFVVVVIYRMPVAKTRSWQSLHESLQTPAHIFIYDNSDEKQELPPSPHHIQYYHDPQNPGVSKAYNETFKRARSMEKKWMLLLDQDALVPSGLLNAFNQSIQRYPKELFFSPLLLDKKGFVSPFRYHRGISKRVTSVRSGVHSLHDFRIINSGSLIHISLFEKTGGYDERFPLDFSDIVFQEKVISHHPDFVLIDSKIKHQLSATSQKSKTISIDRYRSFCESAVKMSSLFPGKVRFVRATLQRAVSLSIQFTSFRFLAIFIQVWAK